MDSLRVWFAEATQGVPGHHQHPAIPSQEGDRSLVAYPSLPQNFCGTQGQPAPSPAPTASIHPALLVLCPMQSLEGLWPRPLWALFPRSKVLIMGVGHTGTRAVESRPGLDEHRGREQDRTQGWLKPGFSAGKGLGVSESGSQGHSAGLGCRMEAPLPPSDPPGQGRPRAWDKDILCSPFLLQPRCFL